MSQVAQVNIEVTLGKPARPVASVASELAPPTKSAAMNALWRFFSALAGHLLTAFVRVRVDAITDYAARLAMVVTQANLAAGEFITIFVPGHGGYKLVAVAAVTDTTDGTFVSQTSNTVTAANIAMAINNMTGLKDLVTASANTGTLTIVAKTPGWFGNTIRVIDGTVNALAPAGGLLAGGLAAHDRVTAAIALTQANITAADTITIGGSVFTWQAGAASADGQVQIGGQLSVSCANLAAAINAHSGLKGLVSAVAGATSVVLTYLVPARVAPHIRLATSDATMAALTQPTTNLTAAFQQAPVEYNCGA